MITCSSDQPHLYRPIGCERVHYQPISFWSAQSVVSGLVLTRMRRRDAVVTMVTHRDVKVTMGTLRLYCRAKLLPWLRCRRTLVSMVTTEDSQWLPWLLWNIQSFPALFVLMMSLMKNCSIKIKICRLGGVLPPALANRIPVCVMMSSEVLVHAEAAPPAARL